MDMNDIWGENIPNLHQESESTEILYWNVCSIWLMFNNKRFCVYILYSLQFIYLLNFWIICGTHKKRTILRCIEFRTGEPYGGAFGRRKSREKDNFSYFEKFNNLLLSFIFVFFILLIVCNAMPKPRRTEREKG